LLPFLTELQTRNLLSREVALLLSLGRDTEHTMHDLNYPKLHGDSALNKTTA